jgi:glycosyltransferase involved in cell wall biosynthesis
MARRLVQRGHSVTMVCGSAARAHTGLDGKPVNGRRRGDVDGIHVIEICLSYSNYDSLAKRSLTFLSFALRSIHLAWKEDYDLLFATSTPLTISLPGIAMRLFKPRKKFVMEIRDLWPELPKAMGVVRNPLALLALSTLERVSYTAMHGGVALSPGIADAMRRRSAKNKPITMVPNGCDLEDFGFGNPEFQSPEWFPANGLRCVFTGAHGLANGLDAVLDAAQILLSRGRRDIHLIFIGDGKLKPQLQKRARIQHIDNCIFAEPLPKKQLAGVLGKTDVGLMILADVPAFYYGTSPNKFFDYIAAGLPVVVNYPGWLADLIRENHCGLALPPRDPGTFADALIHLADQPHQRRQMGLNARRLGEREFSRDILANRWIDFLEGVCRD